MRKTSFILFVVFLIFSSCKQEEKEDLNLKHLNHIAQSINTDLITLKKDISTLASSLRYAIPFNQEITSFPEEEYHYHPGEILFCSYSNLQTAVYLPANKKLTKQLKRMIVNSELLDSFFIATVKKNPLLAQVYFLDTNSFLRIYPYINVMNYLKSSVDLKNLVPYQTVNHQPFLNNEAYWMNHPFADPFGRGWIISCVEPIYYRDQFLGILSGDITLHSLKDKYFSSDTELILLIDKNSKVICCTKEAAKIANIPHLREFSYFKPVIETIYTSNLPSLTNHPNENLRTAIESVLEWKNKETFYMENRKHTIYKSYVAETEWLLLKIIN